MASELEVGTLRSVDGDDYIKIDADTGQVAMYRTGNYIDFLKSSSTFKIRGPGYTDYLTIASTGAVSLGPGTEAVTTLKPSLLVTDTSVGGSVTIRGKSPILAFDVTDSGTGTILTDGGGLNVKDGNLDGHGNTHLAISSTGLANFSNGITVSGGLTSLGSFSELTIASGGITVTNSTHKVDTEGDAATDNLNTITGGTDGSVLILRSVTSFRDVIVTETGNIHLATSTFTLNSYLDRLVLVKSGSYWHEISRSVNG